MIKVITRRAALRFGTIAAAVPFVAQLGRAAPAPARFEVTLTPAQWKARLSPEAYYVLREAGTERPFTSPLNDEHRPGTFVCGGCALPLFASSTKFDSHTGWPSYWAPIKGAVRTSTDHAFMMERVEVHCRRCGGHLGHVFDDGPPPTGKRYCMNGVAMRFVPTKA